MIEQEQAVLQLQQQQAAIAYAEANMPDVQDTDQIITDLEMDKESEGKDLPAEKPEPKEDPEEELPQPEIPLSIFVDKKPPTQAENADLLEIRSKSESKHSEPKYAKDLSQVPEKQEEEESSKADAAFFENLADVQMEDMSDQIESSVVREAERDPPMNEDHLQRVVAYYEAQIRDNLVPRPVLSANVGFSDDVPASAKEILRLQKAEGSLVNKLEASLKDIIYVPKEDGTETVQAKEKEDGRQAYVRTRAAAAMAAGMVRVDSAGKTINLQDVQKRVKRKNTESD